ncbi:MAG: hypothetical protein QOI86_3534 [Actinomycetota bacterium]|jgi:hypothetical protein|nr:hypothetical protein [Actinomycetota bacterium]
MAQLRPIAPTLAPGHLLRHGLLAALLLMLAATGLRGPGAGLSAGTGVALAAANLSLAGRSLDWAAGISLALVAAVALGGYVVRLAAITAVVLLLHHLPLVDLPALAVTLALAHLGLVAAAAGGTR